MHAHMHHKLQRLFGCTSGISCLKLLASTITSMFGSAVVVLLLQSAGVFVAAYPVFPAFQVQAAAALSNVRQVNEEELEVFVAGQIDKPTVIDFYATWCGPCLLLAQELEKVCIDRAMYEHLLLPEVVFLPPGCSALLVQSSNVLYGTILKTLLC